MPTPKTPLLTVDIIIEIEGKILLIERKNKPFGWALPGGFVDVGESCEAAAIREAKEETSLDVFDLKQFGVYSEPKRDPRFHTVSVVFTAKAKGEAKACDDAKNIKIYDKDKLPELAFDHGKILEDYFQDS
ncbi:MAG: NUDIX hydrolase [Pseudomonadota bacterium]